MNVNELIARLAALVQRDRKDGQAMVEYALILSLVSVVAIVMLALIGTNVNTIFNTVAASL